MDWSGSNFVTLRNNAWPTFYKEKFFFQRTRSMFTIDIKYFQLHCNVGLWLIVVPYCTIRLNGSLYNKQRNTGLVLKANRPFLQKVNYIYYSTTFFETKLQTIPLWLELKLGMYYKKIARKKCKKSVRYLFSFVQWFRRR